LSIVRILGRLCCPWCLHGTDGCESALRAAATEWVCARCTRAYPVVDGVPDLRFPGMNAGSQDEHAVHFYEREYSGEGYGRDDQDEHVRPLERWLADVAADALVLELGPGRGALQALHPGYVGTDLSVNSLRRFVRAPSFASDAQRLPLRSGSVDFLYTVAVLEHIPRPERSLAEIARILAPGGTAYLAPAWNCRTWAAQGLHVRPYRDLAFGQRVHKATIPVRDSLAWRGAWAIPKRILRRAAWRLSGRPTPYRYRTLHANFEVYWAADSDATAQLDPHETALYFESRGWSVLSPAGMLGRIFHRAQALVVRRPPPKHPIGRDDETR